MTDGTQTSGLANTAADPQSGGRAAVLAGLGAAVPPRVMDNDEISHLVGSDDTWIRTRTGITARHWVAPGVATGDLAVAAGARALESAGTDAVDLVILATSTPNQPMPATAPEVAAALGLGDIPAYDLSAACTGFVYALSAAAGAIAAGIAARVLVIGADIWSNRLDLMDRSTAVLFGDGAGAAVLRAGSPTEPGALAGFDLGSDGTGYELAVLPAGGSRRRATGEAPTEEENYLAMQGKQIFTHAVARMSGSSTALLKRIGWDTADVDRLVAHQANARILHMVADVLGVDRERAIIHLDRVGNTSAASIPLALTDAASQGHITAGHKVLLTAFGGGLSWGSAALTWPEIKVAEVGILAQ
ncbi:MULTISPECIES: beta-ketoacyl-ACP synthase III [unclassified Streptomyces]|uniref:beta-ketoacyl-ACP synthase III n=1 Tax=unclassified Streptomyces TaxID=2593676 RepID=UPI000E3021D2|nr:beta-ketoacyl-ACP synthase III [Streptomyces sp. AcE210]RFC71505.1 ketoacyl-ACP synthase III [Streptomyces sp. AcE210]